MVDDLQGDLHSLLRIEIEHRQECLRRVLDLQAAIRRRGWQAMLICQNVDLYYFTGTMQAGFLFVPADGETRLIVRRSVSRAEAECAVAVEPFAGYKRLAEQLHGLSGTVGLEFDVMPVELYFKIKQALPAVADWVDGSALIRELRMRKSPFEIQQIRQAAQMADRAFCEVLDFMTPAMSELDVLLLIEQSLRRQGHLGPMRMRGFNQEIHTGLVGAGASGAVPTYFDGPAGGMGMSSAFPQSASRRLLKPNEPIFIDIGANCNGYLIDQTRTVVLGNLSDRLNDAYQLAERMLQELELHLRPGALCRDLYQFALGRAEEAGLSQHFMGFAGDRVKFIGHGIGLEVDEWPVIADVAGTSLEEGMVIALEPKFSFPGVGVVGIEDSYLVTANGCERLSVTPQHLYKIR